MHRHIRIVTQIVFALGVIGLGIVVLSVLAQPAPAQSAGWYYNPFTRKLDFSGAAGTAAPGTDRSTITGTTPVFPRLAPSQQWIVALSASITGSTATGLLPGDEACFEFTQTPPGNYTVVLPAGFPFADLINTASGAVTHMCYKWSGTSAELHSYQTFGGTPGLTLQPSGNFVGILDLPSTLAGFTGAITAGRCVQVNPAGNGLVATAEPCGTGAGGSSMIGEWSSTIDFGNLLDLACLESTFTATGLTTGTPLLLVTPAAINTSLVGRAWASAADTAKVQLCNTSGADVDPASASFTVKAARGYFSATGTIDFANICAGCALSNNLSMTGASTGFGATVAPPAALPAGLQATARVTAPDVVTITIFNSTEADVDPASGSFTAMVIQ